MDINIHSIHFDADNKLIDFVNNKINKLDKYYDNIIDAEAFLRLTKDQELENKIVEIKLNIPGSTCFAKKSSKSFEESTDLVFDALKHQIEKVKEKQKL
ncbi:MAG: ribosome-associated translation inhibitor RaiA [Bacteroidales bacterium]|jgi:putative sigma-54 modulation protein|nr:ribosome-associated translation inhibitor RaiA [Bacteroidales bacterium]